MGKVYLIVLAIVSVVFAGCTGTGGDTSSVMQSDTENGTVLTATVSEGVQRGLFDFENLGVSISWTVFDVTLGEGGAVECAVSDSFTESSSGSLLGLLKDIKVW